MTKWFVFSDPHGNLTALKQGLIEAGYDMYNKNHMLLGLGDYFDRGTENLPMFHFLYDKLKTGKIRLLLGNHDAFLLDFLNGDDDGLFNMIQNGMLNTVNEFSGLNVSKENLHLMYHAFRDIIRSKYPQLRTMLKQMQDSYVIKNYVFTHAGMSLVVGEWGIDNWANTPNFVRLYDTKDKIYVFGHWSSYRLNKEFLGAAKTESDMFVYKNFIGLDTTTTKTNKVNILVIDD